MTVRTDRELKLPSTSGPRHAIVAAFSAVYGVFLAFVAFWPSPVDKPVASLLDRVIAELHERGVPGFIDYAFIEFCANIVLFIPAGLVFGLIVPVRFTLIALLLGPALSGAIEMGQHFLLSARYATVADVVANSLGATIGVLIAATIRAIVAVRDEKVIARHVAQRTASEGELQSQRTASRTPGAQPF
ncbi:VanZ family protein [Microbacterium memoriense]|uniref:VanZ family protein n=1 Tax=Microbacterium memoriense TaxID=2978350 RepID=A0ABT2PBP6_9MICO|nr:VanZ family protein [Microbacterium memoriense]MCT9001992.1 VanZ family protein [Microbacterium memoriense]